MKKRYYNSETKEWYTEGSTMTRRVDNGVFSGIPTIEQLAVWGFEEWIEPAPTPAELLERAKQEKIAELEAYDASDAVNGFDVTIGDKSMSAWLTPEQRANYKNSLDSAELLGMEVVHPSINEITIELQIILAKVALAKIQIYADACYGVTATHKATINSLTTVKEVEEYNYKVGYPEKLIFTI